MTRHLLLLALFATFIGSAWIVLLYFRRAKRSSGSSWQELIDRLKVVSHENVALVALDLIDEDGRSRERDWPELSSEQIWDLVGGMDGLEKIEANCRTLIDIAVYVQTTHPQAVLVAEELRRNTRHIQWHLNRLRAGQQTGNLAVSFAAYSQRAVAAYYLMTKQLVRLCEETSFPGTEQLRAVV